MLMLIRALVLVALVCACGLQVSGGLDERKVRQGAQLAIAEDDRASAIVERLDAIGVPLAEMPRQCRLPEYRVLEGCALWPGSMFARARIYVAIARDDEVAIVKHEILNLVYWNEGYDAAPVGADDDGTAIEHDQ